MDERVTNFVSWAQHNQIYDVEQLENVLEQEKTGREEGGQRATVLVQVGKSEGPDKESGSAMEGCGVGILVLERNMGNHMGIMGIIDKFLC